MQPDMDNMAVQMLVRTGVQEHVMRTMVHREPALALAPVTPWTAVSVKAEALQKQDGVTGWMESMRRLAVLATRHLALVAGLGCIYHPAMGSLHPMQRGSAGCQVATKRKRCSYSTGILARFTCPRSGIPTGRWDPRRPALPLAMAPIMTKVLPTPVLVTVLTVSVVLVLVRGRLLLGCAWAHSEFLLVLDLKRHAPQKDGFFL